MTIMTCADVTATRAACTNQCVVDPALRAHHERLLTVEHDADELVELMELAVTWGELEYADEPLFGPDDWAGFAASHVWVDPERAARIFSLAADIAACGRPSARPVSPAG
ncbi:MAG: hypothetical protein L0H64_19980 [Pseudonocardia sp.]|nr:hypothetical protein [Pseudonocardia sp.]